MTLVWESYVCETDSLIENVAWWPSCACTRGLKSRSNLLFCFSDVLNGTPLYIPDGDVTVRQGIIHVIKIRIDHGLSSIVRGVFIPSVSNVFWNQCIKILYLWYHTLAIGGRLVYTSFIFLGYCGIGVFSMEVRNIPNFSSNCGNIIICSVLEH